MSGGSNTSSRGLGVLSRALRPKDVIEADDTLRHGAQHEKPTVGESVAQHAARQGSYSQFGFVREKELRSSTQLRFERGQLATGAGRKILVSQPGKNIRLDADR